MSLPFLDKKRMAGTIMARKGASALVASETSAEGSETSELQDHAVKLLAGIERKSPSDIAAAFEAMFKCCETYPHDEYGEDEGQES